MSCLAPKRLPSVLIALLVSALGQSPAAAEDRAWLGLQIDDLSAAQLSEIGTSGGLIVVNVLKSSPAELAHVVAGDIVVEIDNQIIRNSNEFLCQISARVPGDIVQVTLIHRKEKHHVAITLGYWPGGLRLPFQECPVQTGSLSSRSSCFANAGSDGGASLRMP